MAITYAAFGALAADATWVARVTTAIIQYASEEPGVLQGDPLPLTDGSDKARRDRWARAVLANPSFWGATMAPTVAMGFLGGADLTSVTDAAIYSRVGACVSKFLGQ